MARWAAGAAGDRVQLRPKRPGGQPHTVTVATVLERDRADGRGFVDEAGATFREFYYDVEILAPTP